MINRFLIKSTSEYRLETLEEVEAFHKELQKQAVSGGYTLSAFSWTEKYIKSKGEIVDSYFHVKCTFIFNELKNPENHFFSVDFPMPTITDYQNDKQEEDTDEISAW